MSDSPDHPTGRRRFLSDVAATTLAVTGIAALPSAARALSPAAPGPSVADQWDDSWTTRVTAAKHKAVFDCPAYAEGDALSQVDGYRNGFRAVFDAPESDVLPVIVIRHGAIPMAFNDHLWDRYEIGKEGNLKDPATGEPARRNPFVHILESDKHALVSAEQSLDVLKAHGAIVLACNLAATYWAKHAAKRTNQKEDAVIAEVRANILPGVILQPNGVYATLRAQEVGCGFMRA